MSLKAVKVTHNEECRLKSMASALYESGEPLLGFSSITMPKIQNSKKFLEKTPQSSLCRGVSISDVSIKNPDTADGFQIAVDWPKILKMPDHMRLSMVLMSKPATSTEPMKPDTVQVFNVKDLKKMQYQFMKDEKQKNDAKALQEARRKQSLGPLALIAERMVESIETSWKAEGYSGFREAIGL